ncbi:hypothetical protein FBBAL38_10122 [Flavobacteria bacterium BAL38]|nr:hypothetical protein FBBAL38_10122 [Flavobacteria bacterium BAL38]
MKENITTYKIYENSIRLNQIIVSEIKENVFKKRFNLSGDITNNNIFEVYNCVSFIVFKPNLGPLIKLKVNLENVNNNKTESVLKLERLNGFTFYVQYWFSLFFTITTFIISLYYLITTGIDNIQSFLLPTISFIYFSIIKLITKSLTKSLIFRIENILKIEKIKFLKL